MSLQWWLWIKQSCWLHVDHIWMKRRDLNTYLQSYCTVWIQVYVYWSVSLHSSTEKICFPIRRCSTPEFLYSSAHTLPSVHLRTSNVTLAVELNIKNRRCPNCFLTPMLVMTSAIRAYIPVSLYESIQRCPNCLYLSSLLTKQHPCSPSLSTSRLKSCQKQAWISIQERMFFVHWLIWN